MIDNQIQQFQHEEFGSIRTINIDGEPWFVGKDVAGALGYSDTFGALKKHVDDEDRQNCRNGSFETSNRGITIINESGLYSLILSSKLPAAKKFKRWVTGTVLPSIRRHGAFFTPETLAAMLDSPEFTRKILETVQAENSESEVLRQQVAVLAPKARYYDIILQSKSLVQTSIIAKDYGLSAVRFNRLLHDLGIQYRMGNTWLLYQEYAGEGYTKSRTYRASENTSVIHTYWTQRGRLFLYERLKQEGIIPRLEADDPAAYPEDGDCP
ncbi:phage antirepressor [Ruminococcaceae bacterium OttesenSCG-928-L11]|nr:phage antirepressor [Ruminococcaceae bacterium OttesenSCG-928-L11]